MPPDFCNATEITVLTLLSFRLIEISHMHLHLGGADIPLGAFAQVYMYMYIYLGAVKVFCRNFELLTLIYNCHHRLLVRVFNNGDDSSRK